MVNGTLMAKGGQDRVNESVAPEVVGGAGAQMQGRKAPVYCDFAALGPKPGELVLHACFARGTTANQRYLGDRQRAGFTSLPSRGRPLELGWRAVTAKQ
jgi:hypothetical protein